MAIGSSLRKMLSEKSPYSEDMRKWQKKYLDGSSESSDPSPAQSEYDNNKRQSTPQHMKEYFKGIDDEGHVSVQNTGKKTQSSPLQSDAAQAAKTESEMRPYVREDLSQFGADQEPNDDIIKAMRKSILDALAGDYY